MLLLLLLQSGTQHLVGLWEARTKPACRLCGRRGYASATSAFLKEGCKAGFVPAEQVHNLLSQLELERGYHNARADHSLRLARA